MRPVYVILDAKTGMQKRFARTRSAWRSKENKNESI